MRVDRQTLGWGGEHPSIGFPARAGQPVPLAFPIEVNVGADPDQVRELLLQTAERYPGVLLQPSPEALFLGEKEGVLRFKLRVWRKKDPGTRRKFVSDVYYAIFDSLQHAGLGLPDPPAIR